MNKYLSKVLILGGGGFLGSHLAEKLLALGSDVSIFDRPNVNRPPNLAHDARVRWFEGEFVNEEELAAAIEPGQTIVHLVSTTLPKSSNDNPIFDIESNLVGTLRLLERMRAHGAHKLLFISSGGTVYGTPKSVPIAETAPTDPICSYGISKLAIEKYLHLYHSLYDIDYAVLRLANPYGERQRVALAQGAIAVFLHKVMRGEPLQIWGDGQVVRDYIYVSDAVDAMVAAIRHEGEPRLFNVGSGTGNSLNDIIATMEAVLGRSIAREHLPKRSFDVPVNVLDIDRAREFLGWEPQVTLTDGLRRTWDWMRSSY